VLAAHANCQNSDPPLGSLREKKLALTKDFTQRAQSVSRKGRKDVSRKVRKDNSPF
jgi:hypothetical protein